MVMRFATMVPVVSAVLALLVSLFQSRRSLHLKILALEHQVAVYQRSVPRPRIQTTDRLLWAWLSRVWAGWQGGTPFCPALHGPCLATQTFSRPLAAIEPAGEVRPTS